MTFEIHFFLFWRSILLMADNISSHTKRYKLVRDKRRPPQFDKIIELIIILQFEYTKSKDSR